MRFRALLVNKSRNRQVSGSQEEKSSECTKVQYKREKQTARDPISMFNASLGRHQHLSLACSGARKSRPRDAADNFGPAETGERSSQDCPGFDRTIQECGRCRSRGVCASIRLRERSRAGSNGPPLCKRKSSEQRCPGCHSSADCDL